jgi:hypothetical protein
LPGERGVAVDEHRQHSIVLRVAAPVLLGARHALDDGSTLRVARVRGECDADVAPDTEVNLPVAPR